MEDGIQLQRQDVLDIEQKGKASKWVTLRVLRILKDAWQQGRKDKLMKTKLPTGFYPFWFWNDRLSADEIHWQIKEMADKGIKGFFIHARQGLVQPYLSEAFFQMVDVAVDAAKKYGLLVHLYDEYPYPSGVAGGEVILGCPQFYATRLVQHTYNTKGGWVRLELPPGKVLSCTAYRLRNGQVDWENGLDLCDHIGPVLIKNSYIETGLTRYNQKRYFASEPVPVLEAKLPEGPHRIFVAVQAEVSHHKYWDQFVDVLNPEAVRRFFALTHERYKKRYGSKFGKGIVSIFVDETQPHWSERIPQAFREEYGYDLLACLPALQDDSHPDHLKVSCDLYKLQYKLFCESFEQPLSEWCRANGLAYSGEKLSLRMSQLRYMDIPGCEPGHVKVGAKLDLLQARLRQNAKATASAAYFYGKSGALCECYHSTGWSATLQDAKFIADGLLLLGIDYLVPHGFFYSTHALKKHDAPPTFFFQMPFWPLFGKLSERVDRIAQAFAGTHIAAELLVVDPASGLPTREDLATYETLLDMLMISHLDFHIVDTDILEASLIERGKVRVAGIEAQVVVLPPMQIVEQPLREWIEHYQACGGTVVRCERGQPPHEIKARLLKHVAPSLSIIQDGKEAEAVYVVKRIGNGKTLWFLLNTSDQVIHVELKSGGEMQREPYLQEIPLDRGFPPLLKEEAGRYRRTIRPFESFLVQVTESAEAAVRLPRITVPVRGPARVRIESPNLLRMYWWQMSLVGDDGQTQQTAQVPAVPISNQLLSGRFRFSPLIRTFFGHEPELDWPRLSARYEYSFECHYAGQVELVMEPGSVVGEWTIYVNNSGPLTDRDFGSSNAHVRGSIGVEITPFLRQGENTIRVEATTDRSDGGLCNALYLAGDFGVALDPVRLVDRPEMGAFERYEENLLPYYAGVITYTTEFEVESIPAAENVLLELDYGTPFHEATEVSVNGSAHIAVAWEPRLVMLPASRLRVGRNMLETRVYTTLVRSFEGQWFDYAAHTYRAVGLDALQSPQGDSGAHGAKAQ